MGHIIVVCSTSSSALVPEFCVKRPARRGKLQDAPAGQGAADGAGEVGRHGNVTGVGHADDLVTKGFSAKSFKLSKTR